MWECGSGVIRLYPAGKQPQEKRAEGDQAENPGNASDGVWGEKRSSEGPPVFPVTPGERTDITKDQCHGCT